MGKQPKEDKKENKFIKKTHWLLLFILCLVVIWNRLDIIDTNLKLDQKMVALEEKLFPKIDLKEDPVLGKNDALVTIVVFSDFDDEFSAKFYKEVYTPIVIDYVVDGKAKIIFKNFPLRSKKSFDLALLGECAHSQNKFWIYHNTLFDLFLSEDKDQEINNMIDNNLDTSSFTRCLEANETKEKINKDIADGNKIKVTGTPTIFINNESIVGAKPYEHFKQMIDKELVK